MFVSMFETGAQNIVSLAVLSKNGDEPLLIPTVVSIVYWPDDETLVSVSVVQFTKFCECTLANLPSWKAAGITAGFTVLIFAIVNPFEVPNDVFDKVFTDD